MKRLMAGLMALCMTHALPVLAEAKASTLHEERVVINPETGCWFSDNKVTSVTGDYKGGIFAFVRQVDDNFDVGGREVYPLASVAKFETPNGAPLTAVAKQGTATSDDDAGDFDLYKVSQKVSYRIRFVDEKGQPSLARVSLCVRTRATL